MQGATPFEAQWGFSRFDYVTVYAEEGRVFDAVMANSPDDRPSAVAVAYDFSAASLIVDVGGGNGALLHAILTRYPQPRGVVFDHANVVSAIPAQERVGNSIELRAGDFFERTLPAADIYLLAWILHDWADEQCLRILGNCRVPDSSNAASGPPRSSTKPNSRGALPCSTWASAARTPVRRP